MQSWLILIAAIILEVAGTTAMKLSDGFTRPLPSVLLEVFHVPMKGSMPLFFAVTALYTFAMSGLGLFVSTMSRNLA